MPKGKGETGKAQGKRRWHVYAITIKSQNLTIVLMLGSKNFYDHGNHNLKNFPCSL
jgi:hypothetical protein